MLAGLDVLGVLGDGNAFALAAALRLGDVRLVLLGAAERLKVPIAATEDRTQKNPRISLGVWLEMTHMFMESLVALTSRVYVKSYQKYG